MARTFFSPLKLLVMVGIKLQSVYCRVLVSFDGDFHQVFEDRKCC